MSYTPTNVTIYNAAQAGALGAILAGRTVTDQVAADYSGLVAISVAIAQEVDTICVTTSTEVEEADMMNQIVLGYFLGRAPTSTTLADYTAAAKAIFALWTTAIVGLG